MSDIKKQHVFDQPLSEQEPNAVKEELNAGQQFDPQETFVPMSIEESDTENELADLQLEQVIRPSKIRRFAVSGFLASFAGLVAWQTVDSVIQALQSHDWLSLGWAGFIAALASLGLGALSKELWKLRSLRHRIDMQSQAQDLLRSNSVGQGRRFCQTLAKQSHIRPENAGYDRWHNAISQAHSDAEVLEMYDAMVVTQQDRLATEVVTKHASESAALVAVSPLAAADMLLVAWRNLQMINSLSAIYGVELGYWSRIRLFKLVLINMAAAGASEVAIDAGMDMMSADLAGRVSARVGQGIGVGLLTARLGVKAMALLRPIPWQPGKQVKLGTIRKALVSRVLALTAKQ